MKIRRQRRQRRMELFDLQRQAERLAAQIQRAELFANTYSEHDLRTCPYCRMAEVRGLPTCDLSGNRHDGERMSPPAEEGAP